jgi:DNA helicase-2/ATP-dependent DNA helicase PcrA
MNHGDNVSFRRVINCPPRGIGTTALSRIEQEAKKKSISLYDANKATLRSDSFTPAVKERLAEFVKLVEALSSAKYKTAAEMLKNIVAKSGYAEILDEKRSENVRALISSAEGKEIKEFLDKVSLSTSMDEINKGDYISLMTLHSVKGLEFPVVFIVGLEEGLLPYCKAIEGKDEIAKERRLFYVGMTRAKDRLWLTGASKRKFYTKLQEQEPSRFLKDIPQNCCQWIEKIKGYKTIKLEPTEKNIEPKYPFTLYAAGCRVKHPTWGIGVVRDCYGDGEEQKVTVNFPNIGLKRLSVKFAHLQRI